MTVLSNWSGLDLDQLKMADVSFGLKRIGNSLRFEWPILLHTRPVEERQITSGQSSRNYPLGAKYAKMKL